MNEQIKIEIGVHRNDFRAVCDTVFRNRMGFPALWKHQIDDSEIVGGVGIISL